MKLCLLFLCKNQSKWPVLKRARNEELLFIIISWRKLIIKTLHTRLAIYVILWRYQFCLFDCYSVDWSVLFVCCCYFLHIFPMRCEKHVKYPTNTHR